MFQNDDKPQIHHLSPPETVEPSKCRWKSVLLRCTNFNHHGPSAVSSNMHTLTNCGGTWFSCDPTSTHIHALNAFSFWGKLLIISVLHAKIVVVKAVIETRWLQGCCIIDSVFLYLPWHYMFILRSDRKSILSVPVYTMPYYFARLNRLQCNIFKHCVKIWHIVTRELQNCAIKKIWHAWCACYTCQNIYSISR